MSGDTAAVDLAMAEWSDDDDDDGQLGLFGDPQTPAGVGKAAIIGRRPPGRPPGARNKRTERTVAFLLARHRDPRQVLLEIAEANVYDLAALYQCSTMEAAQEKRLAATAVLPYVAQRQPLAVDFTSRKVVYLTINQGELDASTEAGVGAVAAVLNSVEYQELGETLSDDHRTETELSD